MQALTRRLAEGVRRPWPDAPVPVALVITDLDVGGAERMLAALATRLERGRWRPTVLGLDREGPLAETLRASGVEVVCLGASPRRPFRGVARLATALRRIRPRLVQSFLFHANVASRLAWPWAGAPWVVGGLRVAERGKGWHRALDRLTIGLSAGSVCVSRGVERFSREVGGLPPARLAVIPNGVDPAPFDRAALAPVPRDSIGVPEGAHLALFVGRLDAQKGLPDLLDAAGRVASASDRPDWHLALAGDGPGRPWLLDAMAGRPELSGRVRWLGRRDDVPALLATADVLVLSSRWEGMPNVVLEAMAARRAVVSTAVEGADELVVPGRTGWLVPPGDAPALAAALLDAARSPDRLRRFGDAARARVEAEFSLDRMAVSYQRLWAGLLGLEWGP